MATDFETLVLRLEANATKFEANITKARAAFDKQSRAIEERSRALEARVNASLDQAGKSSTSAAAGLARFGAAAFAAIGGLSAVNDELKRLADIDDASQKIGVTSDTLQALQFAATQSASSAEEITDALRKFSLEAGQSASKTSELRRLFEANGVALRDANGQLLPMSQLLERFARLVANARNPMEAIAIATIGFGKAGSNLVPLLTQIAGGMQDVEAAAKAAGVVVDESVISAAGKFDDAWTKAILQVKAGIANLAADFVRFGNTAAASGLKPFEVLNPLALPLAGARALAGPRTGQQRIDDAFATQFGGTFKPPGANSDSATVLPPDRGSGSGGGTKTADEYQRETKAIKDKIDALELETASLGLSTQQREAAEAALRLENAARDAGIKLTDDQKRALQALAAEYGAVVAASEAAKKTQADLVRSADEFRSTASSALSGFVNDIRAGKSAAEAFASVLDNLAGKLVDVLTNQAITALLGASGTALGGSAGGGLAALFSAFAGRAGGGSVNAGQPYRVGESGPEVFVPQQAGRILRNGAVGGVSIGPTYIDARGADPAAIARLEARMAQRDRELPDQIRRSVANDRLRGRG